jgi:hypothetical protein
VRERVVSSVLPLAAIAAARVAVALIGVGAAGCETPTAPAGAAALQAPMVFSQWWREVEQCSGLSGDIDRVSWYVVPCIDGESGFKCDVTQEGLCAGEWRAPHVISLGGPNRFFPDGYVDDEWTVKHEMLHDLLGRADHPKEFTSCHLALR